MSRLPFREEPFKSRHFVPAVAGTFNYTGNLLDAGPAKIDRFEAIGRNVNGASNPRGNRRFADSLRGLSSSHRKTFAT